MQFGTVAPTNITSDPNKVTFVAIPQNAMAELFRLDDR